MISRLFVSNKMIISNEGMIEMCKVLVVVDMQNDFISGSLGTREAQAIVSQVAAKVKAYEEKGYKVIYTRDTHTEDYLQTAEGKKLPVKHCIIGEWGWQLEKSLQEGVSENALIIDKETFGSTFLAQYIKEMAEKEPELEVEIVGLCTDICVISNALMIKAFSPEIAISVDSSCCAGVTPESHENALKAMQMCQIDIY